MNNFARDSHGGAMIPGDAHELTHAVDNTPAECRTISTRKNVMIAADARVAITSSVGQFVYVAPGAKIDIHDESVMVGDVGGSPSFRPPRESDTPPLRRPLSPKDTDAPITNTPPSNELSGTLMEDLCLTESGEYLLSGNVWGDVFVSAGVRLRITGTVGGSLHVDPGARALLYGEGLIMGNVFSGGSTFICGKVAGTTHASDGSTFTIHPGADTRTLEPWRTFENVMNSDGRELMVAKRPIAQPPGPPFWKWLIGELRK